MTKYCLPDEGLQQLKSGIDREIRKKSSQPEANHAQLK